MCDSGDSAAGGACGLRCTLGALPSNAVATLSFIATLPAESPLADIRAPMCVCVEDAARGDATSQTGFCFPAG